MSDGLCDQMRGYRSVAHQLFGERLITRSLERLWSQYESSAGGALLPRRATSRRPVDSIQLIQPVFTRVFALLLEGSREDLVCGDGGAGSSQRELEFFEGSID